MWWKGGWEKTGGDLGESIGADETSYFTYGCCDAYRAHAKLEDISVEMGHTIELTTRSSGSNGFASQ